MNSQINKIISRVINVPIKKFSKKTDFSNWCVVTRFKDDNPLLEAFIRFYNDVWNINLFYIGVGESSHINKDIFNRIKKIEMQCKVRIHLYRHTTPNIFLKKTVKQEKIRFFHWVSERLPKNINRIINIDHDEFLYINDRKDFTSAKSAHFHYVEIIPSGLHRDYTQDMIWSLQAWYPRINFFLKGNTDEIEKYTFQSELEVLNTIKNKQFNSLLPIFHFWCKKFDFRLYRKIGMGFKHAGAGSVCKKIDKFNDLQKKLHILHENYLCYHISVPDYDYFKHLKPKWQFSNGQIRMQAGLIKDGMLGLKKYYNKWYITSPSYQFSDNLLRKYFLK